MSVLRAFLIVVICLAGGLPATVRPTAAIDNAPPPLTASLTPVDVTSSPAGLAAARGTGSRFVALGWASPRPLVVWTDAQGILVAPQGTAFERRLVLDAHGRTGTVLVPRTAVASARPLSPAARRTAAALPPVPSPAWRPVAQACFSRWSDVWSWLDQCYQLSAASAGDGWDYWELLRYGTAGANAPWAVHSASIGSYPTQASAVQAWVQWSPLGDQSGPCQSIVVQITSPLAGISWPVDRCDTWTVTKGLTGGTYGLTWSGSGTHGERGLAYVIAVRVPRGAFVQWALPGGSSGSPF